ncbi:MAG: DUF971 domain-containing protein [Pseudomonadota bacterium]
MPTPIELRFNREQRLLFLRFDEHETPFELSYEFLRVHSPSAEVQGHRPEEAILQYGKKNVVITEVESVGNYGIKPLFNDGHTTGIYTWDYLYHLSTHHDELWQRYLKALEVAKLHRE